MTALVTGGAGFMGSHVADQLIQQGRDVIVLDDLTGGHRDQVPSQADFIEGSVTNDELIDSLFETHDITYVFHLAAYAAEGLSHFIRRFNYENNLIGSINLINNAVNHEVECFVFTSSIAVYGSQTPPFSEEQPPDPEDPYGIAKYAVEKDLSAAHNMWDEFNYITFRPHNVYGERQNIGDKYRNVVGIFLRQVMLDRNLTVFGDGEQTRAFTHIDDVAPLIARSINNEDAYNETFNVGNDTVYTVNELAEIVLEAMDAENDIEYLDARNEVRHAFSEHKKAKSVFDYEPSISLEEGVQRMAEWALDRGAREGQEFSNIEIPKNLPDTWS